MMALTVEAQGARLDANYRLPVADPDEALVHVRVAGVCRTDLEIVRGYKGFTGVLGHEFVGEVISPPTSQWFGRRVVGEINSSCGRCGRCARGHPTHCRARTVLGILGRDGAFAEFLTLPLRNLHAVPAKLPDEIAVFVEPLAAAFQVCEQIQIAATDRVLILGDGNLGLLCAQAISSIGVCPLLVGRNNRNLRLAESLGLQAQLSGDSIDDDWDVVVDATGSPSGVHRAIELVRPRGYVALKSTIAAPTDIDLAALVVKEVHLLGSRCGPFPRAIEALVRGTVQAGPLITDRLPLREGMGALERAAARGALKVLLDTPLRL